MKLWKKKKKQNWILQPQKPHYKGITHHFVTSGSKLIFVVSAGGHLGFMQMTKIGQKWAKGQPSWNCSRASKEYKSSKKKNVIGKNISRSHNEIVKRSNRLYQLSVDAGSEPAAAPPRWPLHDPLHVWHQRPRWNNLGFTTPETLHWGY